MSALAVITLILGLLAIGGGGFAVKSPDTMRRGLEKYPRSVWPGRILLAIDMAWSAYAVNQMHLGGFDALKVHLLWLAPVLTVLGALYLDELLSVRALGGLLLLAAGPILAAVRANEWGWGVIISALCYLWIVAGLFFVLEPWWFRRVFKRFEAPKTMRTAGIAKIAAGAALVALALFVY